MLGVEALDFAELDVCVLGPVHGSAGHPPLSAGQTCGQVCASPWSMLLLRPATLGDDFAVSRLPEQDSLHLVAKHDGVVPTPHHYTSDARHLSDSYQMTRRDPLPPRSRELRCVPDRDDLALGQDLAGILLGTQHDAAAEPRGTRRVSCRSSHPLSMRGRCRLFVIGPARMRRRRLRGNVRTRGEACRSPGRHGAASMHQARPGLFGQGAGARRWIPCGCLESPGAGGLCLR